MKRSEIAGEMVLRVKDSTLVPNFPTWINAAVRAIATEFDLPKLKRIEPFVKAVTADTWLYDVPEQYDKKVFRCENSTRDPIALVDTLEQVIALDSDHEEQDTYVCVIGACDVRRKFAVYPKAADTLYLWYYEKPETLDTDDTPLVCIPEAFQLSVVVPKAVLIALETFPDMFIDAHGEPLVYWAEKYRQGLFGSARGDIGMIRYFAKLNPPRRHGGRNPLP